MARIGFDCYVTCGGCYCQGGCLGVVARYGLTLVLVLG
jgi:hypothetical protein